MNSKEFALTIETEKCGECVFCVSVCPYEALSVVPETRKVSVDQNKCRLCGICYATCPSSLINIKYYNVEILNDYIQKKIAETSAQKLVIACRGTSLTPANWQEKMNISENNSLFFTLPCLGRIHLKFLLNTIELGIQKILLIACEEDFCRYKEGSKIMSNKFGAIQLMLEDMGYDSSIIEFRTLTPRANIDETKCIACGTCFFICPYNAIRMESSAKLDKEKCRGCGLCVSNCPAMAITLEGSDFDKISEEIENFAKESIKPKILVLGCQWSEYLSADENANLKKEVKFIRMPCSGRIDVLHILKALSNGIDGILLSICMDDICSFETGNKKTISNISKFIPVFETLNLKERVKLISVHPKYVGMFEEELNNFVQEIKELKPISLKGGEK